MESPSEAECQEIIKCFLGSNTSAIPSDTIAYLAYYRKVTNSQAYRFATCQVDDPLVRTHGDVVRFVEKLRSSPQITRREFERNAFAKQDILELEFRHAVRLIVKVGFMLDCQTVLFKPSYINQHSIEKWNLDKSFIGFVTGILPIPKPEDFNPDEKVESTWAWKLENRCGVKFEKTDDISEHLLYNRKTKVLTIFHHMSYLRHQLQRHQAPINKNLSVEDSLRKGTLPPQLILETLESFYEILFPLVEDRTGQTNRLLRRLIRRKGFDPRATVIGHNRFMPEDFEYLYWGDRLKELAALLRKPPPTSSWMTWFEERTQERNALMIAIVGLFLSALFGLIGCVLAAAQLWITILAWKGSVSS